MSTTANRTTTNRTTTNDAKTNHAATVGEAVAAPTSTLRGPRVRRWAGLALVAMLAVTAAGCGGSGPNDAIFFGSPVFEETIDVAQSFSAAPLGTPFNETFRDEVRVRNADAFELDLRSVIVSSDIDMNFVTRIVVEAKSFFFFETRFEKLASFSGTIPFGTTAIQLPLDRVALDDYINPFTDRIELKVRVEGEHPGTAFTIFATLDVTGTF